MQALNRNFPEKTVEVWFIGNNGFKDVTFTTEKNMANRIKHYEYWFKKYAGATRGRCNGAPAWSDIQIVVTHRGNNTVH